MSRFPEIVAILPVETDLGVFVAHYSAMGLAGLDFPQEEGKTRFSTKDDSQNLLPSIAQWRERTTTALRAVLTNKPMGELPPLDLREGTDFQRKIWHALRTIKAGSTMSYGELAASIGQPKAVRAVGGACGANPIPVIIPCHRVLAANKKIGGFSGGLHWKRRLLEIEARVLSPGQL